jgi:hypothetical protein
MAGKEWAVSSTEPDGNPVANETFPTQLEAERHAEERRRAGHFNVEVRESQA